MGRPFSSNNSSYGSDLGLLDRTLWYRDRIVIMYHVGHICRNGTCTIRERQLYAFNIRCSDDFLWDLSNPQVFLLSNRFNLTKMKSRRKLMDAEKLTTSNTYNKLVSSIFDRNYSPR